VVRGSVGGDGLLVGKIGRGMDGTKDRAMMRARGNRENSCERYDRLVMGF